MVLRPSAIAYKSLHVLLLFTCFRPFTTNKYYEMHNPKSVIASTIDLDMVRLPIARCTTSMVLVLLTRYSSWRTSWSWRRSSLTSTSTWHWTVRILRLMHSLCEVHSWLHCSEEGDTYLKQHDAPEDIALLVRSSYDVQDCA